MLTMGMPHQAACPWIAMQSKKPFNVSPRRSILFLLMFGVAGAAVAENVKKKMLIDMTVDEQLSLVSEMDILVNREAGKGFFFEQDAGPVHVKVSLDVESNHVVMDLDERLGPESQGAEMEDFLDRLRFSIDEQLSRIDGIVGITYLYGGRSSDFWYPEEVSSIGSSRKKREVEGQEKPPLVVISPGHGFYYHHGYKDWRAQRESVNGILEDDITMPMASKLQWALELGGANTRLTRANALGAHQASGLLWSKLSSRYTLEALLPENPEIWHSMPKSTKPLRDRDEDLRSRPLYANFLKADALIHVHTNADGNPKATGATAIIHPGRENQALAKNILCSMREIIHGSMREIIHANESFSDYVVPSDPSVMTNKGENKLAKMPSVIVEVGFHTNPSDAAYLKDVTF